MVASIIQATSSTGVAATSRGLTFTSNTTAGNAVILCVGTNSAGNASDTVTGGSMTWTKVREHLSGTTPDVAAHTAIWLGWNTPAASLTVTYTPAASAVFTFAIMEVSGLAGSTSADQGAEGHSVTSASTIASSSTATLTFSDELVIGMYSQVSNGNADPVSLVQNLGFTQWPCTQFVNATLYQTLGCQYKNVATTAAVSSSCDPSQAAQSGWDCLVQTFQNQLAVILPVGRRGQLGVGR